MVTPEKVRRSRPKPPIERPVTPESAYNYLREIDKDWERKRDEVDHRGLSFGDLKVKSTFCLGGEFTVPARKVGELTLGRLKELLQDIVIDRKLGGIEIHEDSEWHQIEMVLTDQAPKGLTGASTSGFRKGEPYNQVTFLKAEKRPEASAELEIGAYSLEALRVTFDLASRLGLETGPAHYAYESDTPTSMIVDRAWLWMDREVGKYYTEVTYNPTLVKHWSCMGQHEEFPGQGKTTMVIGASFQGPHLELNNIEVRPKRIWRPTQYMLEARGRFRERSKPPLCVVKGCNRVHTRVVSVTTFETSVLGGTSSHGYLLRVCDNDDHLAIVQQAEREKGREKIRVGPAWPAERW